MAASSGDGRWASEDPELPDGGVAIVEPRDFSWDEAKRRWAELIRLVYEVDPLACPRCGGEMHDRPDPGAGGDRQDPALPAREGAGRAGRAVGNGAAGGWGESRGGVRVVHNTGQVTTTARGEPVSVEAALSAGRNAPTGTGSVPWGGSGG